MNGSHISTTQSPRRRGAPPVGQRLGRDAVVAAARDLIEAQGVAGFSLRTLASTLGIRPSGLYNHVRDRDDLLDAVADQFVATLELPQDDLAWSEWTRAAAKRMRHHLLAHPHLTELALTRSASGPARPALMARFIRRLTAGGVDPAVAHVAWHAVLHVVVGAVHQERVAGRAAPDVFDATLEVVLEGIRATARRPPDARATDLLRTHRVALTRSRAPTAGTA